MSRGLGSAQRSLLVALYCAADTFGQAFAPGPTDEDSTWVVVSRLQLVEVEHPKKFPQQRTATEAAREFKRSRRVPYRRALQTLADRGLAEAKLAQVKLSALGQGAWYWQRTEPHRETWLARITAQGEEYVVEYLSEEIEPTEDRLLRGFAYGFADERLEWIRQQERDRSRTRRRRPSARTNEASPVVAPRQAALSRDEVIALFTGEGIGVEQVRKALRAWHREESRRYRDAFHENAPALEEYTFDPDALEEVRSHLSV
ncbi:hypothetical protein [Nocardia wallacei]|uniref:hypothetical protein n=1 Tax=Nocardia wallacei TaxID=480035 RepID=UPI002458212D|nr:hypothetical protein [Nocardia wallacei]